MTETTINRSERVRLVAHWRTLGERQQFVVACSTIAVIGLILRAAAVIATRHTFFLENDGESFWLMAKAIDAGKGFGSTHVPLIHGPTAFRGPVYPLVLAAFFKVVGFKVTATRLLGAVFGAGVVWLTGLVGAQIWGWRFGLLAAALAAVYPPLILTSTAIQYEPLITCLILGALAAALHVRNVGGARWYVLIALLIGVATLTRETGLLMGIPIVVISLTGRHRPRRPFVSAVGIFVLVVLIVLPWSVRNERAFHSFVPLTTSSGYGLAGTFNPTSASPQGRDANWFDPVTGVPSYLPKIKARLPMSEAQIDAFFRRQALDYAKRHPTYVLKVAFWNSVRLFDLKGWGPETYVANYVPYSPKGVKLAVLSFYLALLLAVVALFGRRVREAPPWMWAIIPLALIGVLFIAGNMRYRQPIEPFIVFLAALGIERIVMGVRSRRKAAAATPAAR